MALEDYIDKFSHLNMNANGGRKSPHKVCMLLAVMDLILALKTGECLSFCTTLLNIRGKNA